MHFQIYLYCSNNSLTNLLVKSCKSFSLKIIKQFQYLPCILLNIQFFKFLQRVENSSNKFQVQKVNSIECIHIRKFGLCEPQNKFKTDIQYSSY